jgi:integrase
VRYLRTQEVIDSFMADCELRELSEKTRSEYRRHLEYLSIYCPQLPPRKLGIIQPALISVKGGVYNRHAHWRTFRRFANFSVDNYGIPNFMKGIGQPKRPNKPLPVLSETEINLLPWALETASPRDKAIIVLFLDTAIRQGEACALKREDMTQFEDRFAVYGKTGYRIVPISPITRELCLSLPVHEDGYLFHGTGRYKNTPLGKRGYYDIVSKYLKKIGWRFDKKGAHTLRRSHILHHLKSGGNAKSAQMIAGHADAATTLRYYAPYLTNDVIEQHNKYSPGRVFAKEL